MFRLNIIGKVRSSGTGSGNTTNGESGTTTSWENGQPQGRPRRPPALDIAQIKAPRVASRQELGSASPGWRFLGKRQKFCAQQNTPKHTNRGASEMSWKASTFIHIDSRGGGVMISLYNNFSFVKALQSRLIESLCEIKITWLQFLRGAITHHAIINLISWISWFLDKFRDSFAGRFQY